MLVIKVESRVLNIQFEWISCNIICTFAALMDTEVLLKTYFKSVLQLLGTNFPGVCNMYMVNKTVKVSIVIF